MDLHMPDMDGLTAMHEITRRWPTRRPPVIAMSAENAESERQNCLDAGMNDYVAKPVREPELNAILRKWGGAPRAASGSDGLA
jgi:CheY-like chemotaxis protein